MASTRSFESELAASGESSVVLARPPRMGRRWSPDEHARYLTAMELYPQSSWKVIADLVGTRSVRQVMSHAQKLAQKHKRHARGLQGAGRPPRRRNAFTTSATMAKHRRQRRPAPSHIVEVSSEDGAVASEGDICTIDPMPQHGDVRAVDTSTSNPFDGWSEADVAWLLHVLDNDHK